MAHQRFLSALTNFLPLAISMRKRSKIAGTCRRFALHAVAVSLLALSAAVPGFAATDTVTSLADDGSSGTLRSVIAAAAPGDTIVFSVSGTITLTSGTLVLNQNLTISGPGAGNLAISGNNATLVLQVYSTASMSGVTIENGNSTFVGGIQNNGTLTMSNCTVSGNSGYYEGGGIFNGGTLTLSNSAVSGNSSFYMGGIYNVGTLTLSNSTVSGNSAYEAGGIYNTGTLTLRNSTVSGNSASYIGGGIVNAAGTATLTNSTVSGNSASDVGGGIFNGNYGGTLTLSNSTVSGNSASSNGGGIWNNGPLTAKNTIVANNPGGNCYLYQTITSQGYNLSDDVSCALTGTGDQQNTPAGLDPSGLQNNGGPTQTIALLANSSAVDAIPASACSDAFGNLVLTDQRGFTRPQGSGCDIGAFELTQVATANVCPAGQTTPAPCSHTITLQYNIPPGTTFGTNPVQVVTQGAPNLDFTLASTTCAGSASACIVQVTFAPLAPGVRMGAVQLTDSSGNLVASNMISGIGQGAAIAFGPGTQTTVPASGLSYPNGVAVDAAGNVFIGDTVNGRVVEVPAGGGPQTTLASGLNHPTGMAVDGAGDVFIADTYNSRVVEVPAGGGPQTTVGSGLYYPFSVALDGTGDVFIADTFNNRVVEVPAGGGAQTTVAASGLDYPGGVAVDGAGDVFISSINNGQVVEVPARGGPQTTVPTSGLIYPYGVAVDAAGDVFVVDTFHQRVVEVPAGGGPQTTVASGLNYYTYGVAVDGAGNIFIAGGQVVELQRSQPPALSFAPTPDGNTSSDSPQSITIQNIGNQPLNAIASGLLVGGPNFVQVPGSGTPADCTSSFELTPGATCNLSISFEPQSAGNLTSTATFTDNALNASPSASQIIALQGTGIQTTVNVTVGPSPAGLAFSVDGTTYRSAQSFTWNVGSLHTIATTTPQTPVARTQYIFTNWSDGGALSHSVTASGSTTSYTALFSTQYLLTTAASPAAGGTVSPLTGYQTAGSSVPLVAIPNTGYAFSNWTGPVANANSAATTVSMNAPEAVAANFINTTTTALVSSLNPSTYGQSVTFTASVNGGSTPTGTVTFTADGSNVLGAISLSGGQAALSTSVLGAGGHSIVASYGGDTTHQSSTSTALTQTVQMASTSLGLVSSINPSAYTQAVTFKATVTPQFGGSATGTVTFYDFGDAVTLGTATVSGNQATITVGILPVGTGFIGATYSGDSNLSGSISHQLTQVVKKASTTTVVTSSLNPAFVGQTITFTATVNSQYLGAVSGTVSFKSGTMSLGSATLVNGQASITTSFSTSGSSSITAKYVGDANNTASTSPPLKEVVNKYPSSTSVVSSLNPSIVGESVTFTATVTTGATGTVTFKSGGIALGTVLMTGGTASLSTAALTKGNHNITAVYSGDGTYKGSTSPLLTQVVNKP